MLDVLALMQAMQEMQHIEIALLVSTELRDGQHCPMATAYALPLGARLEEGTPLACVKMKISSRDFQTMDVLCFRLLYMLDGALADKEMRSAAGASGGHPAKGSEPAKV
jgi:hypothetical protein